MPSRFDVDEVKVAQRIQWSWFQPKARAKAKEERREGGREGRKGRKGRKGRLKMRRTARKVEQQQLPSRSLTSDLSDLCSESALQWRVTRGKQNFQKEKAATPQSGELGPKVRFRAPNTKFTTFMPAIFTHFSFMHQLQARHLFCRILYIINI